MPARVSSAAARAAATVPASKGSVSNAPSGPFHTTVADASSTWRMWNTLSGPTSRIIASAGQSSARTTSFPAPGSSSRATTTSRGSRIMQPAAPALAAMSRAVPTISRSASEPPISIPCDARKVLAMPPPITSVCTRPTRLPSNSSLVDTFAPPTTAVRGRFGSPSASSSARSSASISRPAQDGSSPASASVVACDRCAALNASLQ